MTLEELAAYVRLKQELGEELRVSDWTNIGRAFVSAVT